MASTLSNLMALLALDNSSYLDGLTSSKSATDSFADKLSNVGGAVVVGALSVAATAITTVGIAAWDAGNMMDEAMDTIATATGATGPTLAGLREDFEAVFTSVPTDAKTAADVIGVLNSRLDASGPALQGLAEPLLEVSRLLGGDAKTNAELFTRVMGDWTIPTENGANSLDMLFVAAQKTGAPLDALMGQIVQYGAPMRNFGFDFADAGALLASFAAQGVNTEIVMAGLRTAQGKFIKNGIDMKTGLWETIDSIQNAESSTDALAIATEIFGAKAAGDMFDTIRSGKFDIQEMTEQMWDARGTVMETADATADWGEKWMKFKNQVTVALAPIGETMMDGVGKAMDSVVAIFERPDVQAGLSNFVTMIGSFITSAVAYIPVLIDGFFQFISFLQNNQGVVVGVLAALGVAAVAWGVVTAAAAWAAMAPLLPVIGVLLLIAGAAYLLYQAWTNNWGGIRDTLMNVWANLQPTLDALKQWLSVAIPAALQWLSNLWTGTLLPALQAVWNFISTYVLPILGAVGEVIAAVIMNIFRQWSAFITNILVPNLRTLWSWIEENILPTLQRFAAWVNDKVRPALMGIDGVIQDVIGWLGGLADMINNLSLPDWLTPGSPTPWELGLRGIGNALHDLSRSELPSFQAAVSLQAEPFGASGAMQVTPGNLSVSAETDRRGGALDDAAVRELIRILRDLPKENARLVRDAVLLRSG